MKLAANILDGSLPSTSPATATGGGVTTASPARPLTRANRCAILISMARDNKGRWEPGSSGNRKGKAKLTTVGLRFSAAIRDLVGEQGEKLITLAWQCAEDAEAPWGHRLDAIKWLAERGFGRPTEVTDVEMEDGTAVGVGVPGHKLEQYTDQELREMIREAERREMPLA